MRSYHGGMIPLLFLFFGVIPTKVSVVTTDVYFGGKGPYRFLVDTGSQSTLVEPELAAEIGLRPEFQVEVVTVLGSHLVAGTHTREIKAGGQETGNVEVLFEVPGEAKRLDSRVRGVLGANALASLRYLLSPREGVMEVGGPRPEGVAVPFETVNGVMVIEGRMGKEPLRFVLDSGASHVVLFRTPEAMAKTRPIEGEVKTLDGARRVAATTWTADMVFGEHVRVPTQAAAMVPQPARVVDGLLPAAVFKKVFVDRERRELVLVE